MSTDKSILARALMRGIYGLTLTASVLTTAYVLTQRSSDSRAADSTNAPQAAVAKAAGGNASGETGLKVEADDQEKGGIETAAPKEIAYQEQVRAYGLVLPLDRLAALYNNSASAAQQLKAAEIKLQASQTANARAHNLLKVFPTAAAQAETAEATQNIDDTGVEAAKVQIEALKTAAIQEWGSVLGQAAIERSDLARNLILRKSCLIQLTVQPGATAEPPAHVKISIGGTTVEASFLSEAVQTDSKISNLSFFYVMPAVPGALAGTAVAAWFEKGEAKPSVVIPPSAIIWQAGRPWVYIHEGRSEHFERKAIDDAVPTADGGYVLPSDRWPRQQSIVVAGAQALLSEETRPLNKAADDDD